MMTTLVTSVGYPASGKSVVAEWMRNHNISVVRMGDRLRKKFEREEKPDLMSEFGTNRESDLLGEWATQQRDIHGEDVVAQWTANHIESEFEDELVFVDGVRSKKELSLFKNKFESVYTIYIATDKQERLERIRGRGREGESNYSLDDLTERDRREESWGLDEVIKDADFHISNNGTLQEFREKIARVFGLIQDLESN